MSLITVTICHNKSMVPVLLAPLSFVPNILWIFLVNAKLTHMQVTQRHLCVIMVKSLLAESSVILVTRHSLPVPLSGQPFVLCV